jgi:hypothetical protein
MKRLDANIPALAVAPLRTTVDFAQADLVVLQRVAEDVSVNRETVIDLHTIIREQGNGGGMRQRALILLKELLRLLARVGGCHIGRIDAIDQDDDLDRFLR